MPTTGLSSRRPLDVVLGSLVVLLLAVTPVVAQGNGNGGVGNGNGKGNQKHHDRSNPLVAALPAPAPDGLAAAPAVQSAGQEVVVALRSGTLVTPSGDAIPAESQQAVLGALSSDGTGDVGSLVFALISRGNGNAKKPAMRLVESLSGVPDHPDHLQSAVKAFNSFVNASSAEFLTNPPPEFLAIQAALTPIAQTAALTSTARR